MPTPEGKLKAKIKARLKQRYDEMIWMFWPVSTGFGMHGVPDLVACLHGLFIGIEVKPLGGKATALQLEQIRRINAAGGMAWVVDSMELLEQVCNQIDFVLSMREPTEEGDF